MKKRKLSGLTLRKKMISNLSHTLIGGIHTENCTKECSGTPNTFGNGACGGDPIDPDPTSRPTVNTLELSYCNGGLPETCMSIDPCA